MLRLRQPNNRDYAWMILQNLSGERFPASDVEAWQRDQAQRRRTT